MRFVLKTIIVIFLSLILYSLVVCSKEIESKSETPNKEASSYNIVDTVNGTWYNISNSDIDGPESPDPNPVVTIHYEPSHWLWVLVIISAIAIWIIKKPKRKPNYISIKFWLIIKSIYIIEKKENLRSICYMVT